MPRLSDTMEEGTILRWLKSDGDQVRRGEELVEIETDKAAMTYEADSDGLLQTLVPEGDTLPIGQVIARIADPPTIRPKEPPRLHWSGECFWRGRGWRVRRGGWGCVQDR